MSRTPTGRRKGGQPGNTNRLKHGLYSRRLTPDFDQLDPRFQLTLARKRLAQLLRQQESASPHDYLSYERGILHYLSLISNLWQQSVRPARSAGLDLLASDGHPFVGILESIHSLSTQVTDDQLNPPGAIRTSDRLPRD